MTGPPRREPPMVPDPGRAASRAVSHFVARFLAGWALVLGLNAWAPGFERGAIAPTISSLGVVARACGQSFRATGPSIQIAGVGMQIVPDCTPLMPIAALVIAVVAFPAPWLWRLGGVLAGAAVLWIYNLVRIFALVPVLRNHPEWFDFIHVYLWQTATLLVVFGLFMAWLGLQRPQPTLAAPPPSRTAPGPNPGFRVP